MKVRRFCVLLIWVTTSSVLAQSMMHEHSGELFQSEVPLEITLTGDVSSLFDDRKAEEATFFDFTLRVNSKESTDEMAIRVKTRGNFRRLAGNCSHPPLWLNFEKSNIPNNSIFFGETKLKLVMPCRGQRYVIREYLAYKLHNLLTPLSFRARLVKVRFIDGKDEAVVDEVMAFVLEDEDKLAARNGGRIIKTDSLRPKQIDRSNFLQMAIFEYLIGNTDWSVQYRQNIKLIEIPGEVQPRAVPYDFDHAGLVSAPYAHPAPELKMSSVRQRRYRGYCLFDMAIYEESLRPFRELHPSFLEVVSQCAYLDDGSKKYLEKYLNQFQKTINNPKKWQAAFSYPCSEFGTGNVVIKGMRN